jgi:hypothetical protein
MDAIAAELPPAIGAFERAAAFDSTGHSSRAAPPLPALAGRVRAGIGRGRRVRPLCPMRAPWQGWLAMGQVIILALTSSLNPTLLTATSVMLLLDRPVRLMLGYLLGAYTASLTLGLVIVFTLSDSSAVSTTQHTVSPGVDIALGVVALAVALVLHSSRRERVVERWRARESARQDKGPPRWQRQLSQGSPKITFAIGAMLTLPGASYLAGLVSIHRLDCSPAVTVLLVIGFNVVMLWMLEAALACWLIAPEATPRAIDGTKAWARAHGRAVAEKGLALIGTLLIVKGIIGLIA